MKTAEEWDRLMPKPLGEIFLIERGRTGWSSDTQKETMHAVIDSQIHFASTIDEYFWVEMHAYIMDTETLPSDWLQRTLEYKRKLDKVCKAESQASLHV